MDTTAASNDPATDACSSCDLHAQIAAHREAERSLFLALLEADTLLSRWQVVATRIRGLVAAADLP